ncbi:chromatin assembly factor 1 subunit A isoform X1 [Myiozetetes cayanensis]|uniref:chromatin assembly factor 1 subunit A isoform X1 n=1 Tax=Myiozetetes cayanensis TaxID=478635 RepID=UPI00216043A2|nr:chromatin assembly factor 1 subunit A isoform X1 [Myiozetetes cayanensis]XP_050168566.1 chromatin assembly factor 1 subunit A isoform X2 [Myiozetetes cayanensis]XP_050168567.1 chromatin assembly factor 1 subunit A isoform X3 [Myiozetetes cayanensis]XP_050168568.1 chromatin assembly factor 1 subunit A isoform X4 [Myiozetetes cayanensis]XP_050168569.1 chromatin assembly factor 1 subunit A isoform X1 [Myiozetetes cayanensis]
MECRDKGAVPPRKLVQARLPFKRLNPVPKDKYEVDPEVKKAKSSPSKDPTLDSSGTSLDNVENDCQLGPDGNFSPKLVNGKGPLDHFIQKNPRGATNDPEPPKGSAHGLGDATTRGGLDPPAAPPSRAGKEGKQLSCLSSPQSAHGADPTGNAAGEGGLGGGSQPCSPCRALGGGQSELRAVLFEGKVPVVLLQDIMAGRDPQGAPPEGNEALESSPEGDSGLSESSLSSGSSPELGVGPKRNTNPLAASTPLRKVPQKFHRSSAEKEKLRLQRDQERADKLQKLQAEREEKGRLKEEAKAAKERAKEEAKKRKEEEKELKEKERREKKEKEEKEKAEKLRVKEEKRKERQEALEAKLEEKRKKEEEKRLREEEKRINAQKAEITRFFQKPKTPQAPKILAGSCGKFAPFEIKENMVLAPLSRVVPDPDSLEQLDKLLPAQDCEVSFLRDLKCRKPRKSGATWVRNRTDTVNSDVVVVDSCQRDGVPDREQFGRMKLLQFSENHRPAYWGTWNKSTTLIRARNPWAKDSKLLDYEVDSDEEWEEEEPGESLSHSEEDDEEEGEDEDEDDGFFVPHGYLSEDEGVTEECDPENQKVRQKLKAKEWDELIAKGKRFHVLQPVKIGCVWEGAEQDSGTNPDLKVLQQFTACVLDPPVAEEEQQTQKCSKKRARDQQILGHLLPLLHGNVNGSKVIIQEFQECCRQGLFSGAAGGSQGSPLNPQPPCGGEDIGVPSKARLKRIISESSVYEKRPEHRMCWYVHMDVLRSFQQEHLPVPCQWNYVTQVPCSGLPCGVKEEGTPVLGTVGPQSNPAPAKRKGVGSMSITRFMKRARRDGQAEAVEMDGFQADTEEDEEDDDCMIVDVQPAKDSTASEPSGTRAAPQDTSPTDTV